MAQVRLWKVTPQERARSRRVYSHQATLEPSGVEVTLEIARSPSPPPPRAEGEERARRAARKASRAARKKQRGRR